jgi:hypothetical protein
MLPCARIAFLSLLLFFYLLVPKIRLWRKFIFWRMSAFADGSPFLPDRVSTFEMEQLYSVGHSQLLSK